MEDLKTEAVEAVVETSEPVLAEETKTEAKEEVYRTQAEFDAAFSKRINKERSKWSKELGISDEFSKEEFSKYKEWSDSQKTEAQKLNEKYEASQKEIEALKGQLFDTETTMTMNSLGFNTEHKSDILMLAKSRKTDDNNMADALKLVADQYPNFLAQQNVQNESDNKVEVKIGNVTKPETKTVESDYLAAFRASRKNRK